MPYCQNNQGSLQLVHSASVLDINAEDTSRVNKSLFSFMWDKKQDAKFIIIIIIMMMMMMMMMMTREMLCAKTTLMEAIKLSVSLSIATASMDFKASYKW